VLRRWDRFGDRRDGLDRSDRCHSPESACLAYDWLRLRGFLLVRVLRNRFAISLTILEFLRLFVEPFLLAC